MRASSPAATAWLALAALLAGHATPAVAQSQHVQAVVAASRAAAAASQELQAAAAFRANAATEADPCAGSAEIERCHYESALAQLTQMEAAMVRQTAALAAVLPPQQPDRGAALPVSPGASRGHAAVHWPPLLREEDVQPDRGAFGPEGACPIYFSPKECMQRRQVLALLLALQALEGQPPMPPSLDGAAAALEEAVALLEGSSVRDFRRTQLASAINARRPPASAAERAARALKALERVRWPSEGPVPTTLLALRKIADGSDGAASPGSFLGGLRAVVGHWLPAWLGGSFRSEAAATAAGAAAT